MSENILICPLQWGLGHTTRCIAVAYQLKLAGCNVHFACSPKQRNWIESELNGSHVISFWSYNIRYTRKNNLMFILLMQLPKLLFGVFREHRELQKLIARYRISTVISDNRYGCYSKKTHNVLMTHQLSPHLPGSLHWLKIPLNKVIRHLVSKFDQCWIPDDPGLKLTGELTSTKIRLKNIHYTGILSRFPYVSPRPLSAIPKFKWLGVISGPEPQRTMLEKKLFTAFKNTDEHCLLVGGKPGLNGALKESGKIWMYPHLSSDYLKHALTSTAFIVCRSGYSTIMDLVCLHRTALLIPTPGQTEQEYLADYLSEKGFFEAQSQYQIDLKLAAKQLNKRKVMMNYERISVFHLLSKSKHQ